VSFVFLFILTIAFHVFLCVTHIVQLSLPCSVAMLKVTSYGMFLKVYVTYLGVSHDF
jgi:hypothetical protein